MESIDRAFSFQRFQTKKISRDDERKKKMTKTTASTAAEKIFSPGAMAADFEQRKKPRIQSLFAKNSSTAQKLYTDDDDDDDDDDGGVGERGERR